MHTYVTFSSCMHLEGHLNQLYGFRLPSHKHRVLRYHMATALTGQLLYSSELAISSPPPAPGPTSA